MKNWNRSVVPFPKDLNWNRFFGQFQKDLKLWIFCVFIFLFFRLTLIFSFRNKISDSSNWSDILAVLVYGFRYDSRTIISYFILIPLLLSVLCGFIDVKSISNRVRSIMGSLFLVVTTILSIVTIGYFKEFNDQFNHFIFELYYDDPQAILSTIWSEYNPILNFLIMGIIIAIGLLLLKGYIKNSFISEDALKLSFPRKIIISFLILFAFVIGIRGSIGRYTAKRMNAAVTRDEFLNKTVFNVYTSLLYAIEDHLRLSNLAGLKVYLPDEDVRKAAKYFFSTDTDMENIDSYMAKYASGIKGQPARHIFVIVMESYDAWSMLPKYDSLGLKKSLKQIASKGLYFENFLPASSRTMASFASIITGLPDAGVRTDYQKSAQTAYPSSIAETFKRLGYRTKCFYGGYLSWHRIGTFAKSQGFEEIYGASHIGGNWLSKNAWGVDDEFLFDYVVNNLDDSRPSFNIILTTSSHPPYDIDLEKKGFPLDKIPDDIMPFYDNRVDLKVYGHMWYADQCLGKFIAQVEDKIEFPLFAITGDHFSRRFLNSNPDFFEESAVPLVLYGKDVLKGYFVPNAVGGSHIDIAPTLVELVAPKGFRYYAMGRNLLDINAKKHWGIGKGKVIGPDFIANVSGTPKLYALPGKNPSNNPPNLETLKRLHDVVHGISWWRIMRGSNLPLSHQELRNP